MVLFCFVCRRKPRQELKRFRTIKLRKDVFAHSGTSPKAALKPSLTSENHLGHQIYSVLLACPGCATKGGIQSAKM